MKRVLIILLIGIFIITGLLVIVNIEVTTRQGINYQWHTIEIPLYLKILDFFDRHYNYRWLVNRIINNKDSDETKVLKIFHWTCENIKHQPKELPAIDDHVWHIIVRGYGARDQISDVFTTLCNYAGVDAYFGWVYTADRTKRILLSFVKIGERWCIFDPFNGSYFKNKDDKFADIEEIKSGSSWSIENLGRKSDIDYPAYFDNLPPIKDAGLTRANTQSPLNRLLFELKE